MMSCSGRDVIASQRVGARRRPMTGSAKQSSSSFRGDAKHRTRNLEIPGLVLTHHPGMTESDCFVASAPRNDAKRRETQMAKVATAVGTSAGQCLCGKVCFEIDTPARWAWHDHSLSSRRAHGAAYATYVGSWRKRFRIIKGKAGITRSQG